MNHWTQDVVGEFIRVPLLGVQSARGYRFHFLHAKQCGSGITRSIPQALLGMVDDVAKWKAWSIPSSGTLAGFQPARKKTAAAFNAAAV